MDFLDNESESSDISWDSEASEDEEEEFCDYLCPQISEFE